MIIVYNLFMEKILTISILTYNSNINDIRNILSFLKDFIDEIDVLIVDDHSTIENFEKLSDLVNNEFNFVKLIYNEENLNISKNGLKSMKLSTTKYVKRIDSDDTISSYNEFRMFLDSLKQNDFDLGLNNWYFTAKRKKMKIKNNNKVVMFNANSVFRTEMIRKIDSCDNVVSYLEDKYLLLMSISHFNPKIFINNKLGFYVYLTRSSSTTKHIYSDKEKYLDTFFSILKEIQYSKKWKLLSKENNEIIMFQVSRILSFVYILKFTDLKKRKKTYKWLEDEIKKIDIDLWNNLNEMSLFRNYLKLTHLYGFNIFLKILCKILF